MSTCMTNWRILLPYVLCGYVGVTFLFFIKILYSVVVFRLGYNHIPGVVVAHYARFLKTYVGSPSLCRFSASEYYATHDLFGPKSHEFESPTTFIYKTNDAGQSWRRISTVAGSFWARLFTHNHHLYLFGVDKHHGNLVIRRSFDKGVTWTEPYNATDGLLRVGRYHAAPTPVIIHDGRIWLACERADGPLTEWGKCYGAMLLSASVDADLLHSESWKESSVQYYNSDYLEGQFGGFLEGNVVVTPAGLIHNILRVEDDSTFQEKVAVMTLKDTTTLSFSSDTDFRNFPGGSKKFTIRYDDITGLYLSLTNVISESDLNVYAVEPDQIRNTVTLVTSADLITWKPAVTVLTASNFHTTAYQYIDWDFDSNDIILISRTATSDWCGGARSYHDSNFLTFHRINDFRSQLKIAEDD